MAFCRSAAEACSADLANFSASLRPSLGHKGDVADKDGHEPVSKLFLFNDLRKF